MPPFPLNPLIRGSYSTSLGSFHIAKERHDATWWFLPPGSAVVAEALCCSAEPKDAGTVPAAVAF